jgi:uncharacterized membrane protein YvlD (DUF360 family)
MWIIIRSLLHIIAYSLSLYLLDHYGLLWWIHFNFAASSTQDIIKVYALLGLVFWICFAIIKSIINILALPLKFITLWLIGFVINIAIFYLCQILINTYLTGIEMQITSLTWLVVVSFILSVIVSFVYRLLKQVI